MIELEVNAERHGQANAGMDVDDLGSRPVLPPHLAAA